MMDKRILQSFLMMGFGLDQRPKLSIPYTRSYPHLKHILQHLET